MTIVIITYGDMEKRKMLTFFSANSSVSLYCFLEKSFERGILNPSYPEGTKQRSEGTDPIDQYVLGGCFFFYNEEGSG
ncbi:hypothetical protein [Elizabethkingia miricola]|nr:hypothetical protein [Elizabethkingia miricola]WGL75355.1 hypothetical protein QFB80_15535 [Elizabethkingia miricola]